MTSKLRFQEHPTGWSVLLPVFALSPEGERLHTLGRLEQLAKDERWCFLPESGDGLTLSELDQIRHKMANLEQLRLNKEALNK